MRELLRLLGLLRPHRARIALGLGLALLTVLANIGLLALSSWFIASMALAGSLGLALAYELPAAAVRALAIIRAGGRYAERLVNHDTTFRILGTLRLWFFERIGPLAPARIAGYRSGDLLARIRGDIDSLDDYYVRGLVPAGVALLSASCILPFLASFDWRLALIDGLALAGAGLAVPALLAALAARPGREKVLAAAELRAGIIEELEGLPELIALGAAAEHATLVDALSARLDASQRRLASLGGLGEATMAAVASLALGASSLVLVTLLSESRLPPADLAGLSVFVLASFETILPLPAAIQKAGEMAAAARRLFEIIDAQPEVEEAAVHGAAGLSPCAKARGDRAALPDDSATLPDDCAVLPDDCAALPDDCAVLLDDPAALPDGCAEALDDRAALLDRSAMLPGHPAMLLERSAMLLDHPATLLADSAMLPDRPAILLGRNKST